MVLWHGYDCNEDTWWQACGFERTVTDGRLIMAGLRCGYILVSEVMEAGGSKLKVPREAPHVSLKVTNGKIVECRSRLHLI